MKSIMKFFACAVLVMSCLTAQVNAASGDSTVSLGFAHIRFPGLKDFVRDAGVYNRDTGNDSNLLIVFYVQIMPDDLVMQLHRF